LLYGRTADLKQARMTRPITGLTLAELTELLASRPRALTVLRWLHSGRALPVSLPERISGVSAKAWAKVRAECELELPRVVACRRSRDGAVKYALEADGARFEAVLIPERGRSTLCVSSQSGCTRKCAFCATARLGFARNLTASEIVGQLVVARGDAPAQARLRNVVFMGMGEPLDNLDEVLRAIAILTQAPAPQLGAGHVTVSTCGVLPGMRRFLDECDAHLALSLNATTDQTRARLMPQSRAWPIAELMDLLRRASRGGKRLFFVEYVLLAGVNDSDADAQRLVALLEGVRARVNLIAHNGFEGCPWVPPTPERIEAFQSLVHRGGIRCLVRSPHGQEIDAACGQLALRTR
jgi:23S rRNA (adenine2503-C2)-methyltransferase